MARRRPTAFDVSFPDEATPPPAFSASSSNRNTPPTRPNSLKRKSPPEEIDSPSQTPKRQQLPPVAYYEPQLGEIKESARLVVAGEDLDDGYDSDEEGRDHDKPIRVLTSFSVFDPKHRNEMVSLVAIEEDEGLDRQFEGAGYVFPSFVSEEDEGQEDGLDAEPQYIRLGAILRYTFDFTKKNDPVYIETEYAWYILKTPSIRYQPYFRHFYSPRRIAQLVVSSAIEDPQLSYDKFVRKFVTTVDTFGRTYVQDDLGSSILDIQDAIEEYDSPSKLKATPLVKQILRKAPSTSATNRTRLRRQDIPHRGPPPSDSLIGNPDLAVLKPENQTPTHVTPLIASLAQGLVNEQLIVLGPPPPPVNKALIEVEKKEAHKRLLNFITRAKIRRKIVNVKRTDHYAPQSQYLKAVEINHETYHVGDFVVVPIGQTKVHDPPGFPDSLDEVSPDATLADYFWFARIIYMDVDSSRAHVQWLEHGSQTILEELAHSQELFYNNLCTSSIDFEIITAKVVVHERPKGKIPSEDFFVKFVHDKTFSTFTSIDDQQRRLVADHHPPNNCHICPLEENSDHEKQPATLKDSQGLEDGVAYGGQKYHLDDFVLYRAEDGPAHIGYIQNIVYPQRRVNTTLPKVYMRRVGRINTVLDKLPVFILRDERHVFITDEITYVSLADLIRVCYVLPFESIPDLENWLSLSPDHYYLKFAHPTLEVNDWDDLAFLPYEELPVCAHCIGDELNEYKNTMEFLDQAKRRPLPTLDLFGGVGAFGLGLAQGSGSLEITHAIEISPSAAKTHKRNFPQTLVYNQCANTMLRREIKHHQGHETERVKQLYDSKEEVPEHIRPGFIKCVLAGFPCQTHSALNMYKRADDIKSNLVLTALSWVDYTKAEICYFENVPGFLNFSFDAVQAGRHRVEGGIPMGGLKLTVRALIDMGYQVRFGLLQAGNYGTPQFRVRFFIIAAIDGHPLPELPQPTHDFPVPHGLKIKHPIEGTIRPIRTDRGTAPHPFVTIDDAISDLPRFDWKHPRPGRESAQKRHESRQRAAEIPALPVEQSSRHCGFQGVVEYYHGPRSTYQLAARAQPTDDLQHFTKCLLPKKVERVVSVPMSANADYRDLRPDLQEWQTANPLSSIARNNYRPGVYGRLDKNSFFPTTVTNMDPTAKQSKVLNPYCKRMVTVRELARSQGFPDNFVFESIGNNVVTMHRQIGNAVPIPVGLALGRELRRVLYQKWLKSRENAIKVDDD